MGKRSYLKFSITLVIFLFTGLMFITENPQAAPFQGNPISEWSKSKHADRALAIEEATIEHRGATAAHCGRCHSQQGYLAWLPQLMTGDPGLIKKPDGSPADVDYLASLGLTVDTVQPITCVTCHADDFSPRVANNTPLLPAGFAVQAVGRGALCMTCHNTRNGRIQWDASDPGRYTGPHEPAQTDVIAGKNAYFINDTLDGVSPHILFTSDACVTCHLELAGERHTFEPAENVCYQCHGPFVTPDFVQKPTAELLVQTKDAIQNRILAVRDRIGVVRAWDPETDTYTNNFPVDVNKIDGLVDILTIHGQIGYLFTLADGSEVYTQANDIRDVAGGTSIFATSNPIVRASWNYLHVRFDGSRGVHNPKFTRDVLSATINALK